MQLAASALPALWGIYDATGIRPEWLLPTLWIESGFDPSIPNAQGAPYYGIGQSSAGTITAAGASSPAEFLTWSAGDQLARAVGPFLAGVVSRYGDLRSGVRVYQANYLPGTLPTIRKLWQVVAWRGSPWYDYNQTLDVLRDGAITLSDIAWKVAEASRRPEVLAATLAVYMQRPAETPTNPVFGADYTDPKWWVLAPVLVGAYAAGR